MGENIRIAGAEAGEDLTPEFTLEELMDEIFAEYFIPRLADGEFTARMFARRQGVTYNVARRCLDQAVADGKLEAVGERKVGRFRAMAYRVTATTMPHDAATAASSKDVSGARA